LRFQKSMKNDPQSDMIIPNATAASLSKIRLTWKSGLMRYPKCWIHKQSYRVERAYCIQLPWCTCRAKRTHVEVISHVTDILRILFVFAFKGNSNYGAGNTVTYCWVFSCSNSVEKRCKTNDGWYNQPCRVETKPGKIVSWFYHHIALRDRHDFTAIKPIFSPK